MNDVTRLMGLPDQIVRIFEDTVPSDGRLLCDDGLIIVSLGGQQEFIHLFTSLVEVDDLPGLARKFAGTVQEIRSFFVTASGTHWPRLNDAPAGFRVHVSPDRNGVDVELFDGANTQLLGTLTLES